MRNVAILTHYYNSKNLGGLLQAFALTNFLNRQNYTARQISFDQQKYDFQARQLNKQIYPQSYWKKLTPKRCFAKFCSIIVGFKQQYQTHSVQPQLNEQNRLFIQFETIIPHYPLHYDNTNIKQTNDYSNTFIIGSDQVFSSYFLPLSAFFGEFTAPDKKVISYAASSNVKKFPPLAEKLFIKKLQRVNAVSVREQTLKEYIEKITNKKATVVLDPTFLLSPADWLKIANPAPVPPKKYIFCYFLGNKSVWQRKAARAYADKYGYELVHLPYITQTVRPADKFLKGQGRYDVGPREFISLINGAECIFTDSFHGLAFSINFSKQFYVFNRDDKSGPESMIARITDTLDLFRLQDRHITTPNAVPTERPINYIPVQEILASRKKESMEWLLNALEH